MMKPHVGWGVFCLLTCLPISSAMAAKAVEARSLLERVSNATRSLSYDGTFVYVRGKSMDSMRVIHHFDGKNEKEKLISLTGQASEIIRNKDGVLCVLPNSKKVIIEKAKQSLNSFPSQLAANFSKVEDFYKLSLIPGLRIAGKNTHGVNVEPRDKYRYGYRLWVDDVHGLLLKTELVNEGQVLEQVMFTSLEVKDSIPAALLKPSVDVSSFQKVDTGQPVARKAVGRSWHLSWLPGGFDVTESDQVALSENEYADHIVLTDGLSMVSVFIEPDEASSANEATSKGALSAYTVSKKGYRVTAVGEVPPVTVKEIADAIMPQSVVQNQ